MGRKRKDPNDWLPPYVYRRKDGYRWEPREGGNYFLCEYTQRGGQIVEPPGVRRGVLAALERQRTLSVTFEKPKFSTMLDNYFKSRDFTALSSATQADYRHYAKRIYKVFGSMDPRQIRRPHVRQFVDAIADAGYPTTANRHGSFMSTLLGWGSDRDWCDSNVAYRLKKFPEKPRDRYVTDEEFLAVFNYADERGYTHIAAAMDLAYLCRARGIEVRSLYSDERSIREEGIYLPRAKGSLSEITAWSPRLRAAVNMAFTCHDDKPGNVRLLRSPKTHRDMTKAGFHTAWTRIMQGAMEKGLCEYFHYHDIKAKGVTDHKNPNAGKHLSKKMLAVYNRKPDIMEPTR